ncbi:MAG TPA: EthD domain-containing protein [Gaiellales bacterium]
MVVVMVTYEELPDPDRYAEHAELCRKVPGGEFRHGPVFGSPLGDPAFAYVAEWRFPDMDAFKAATRTPEFAATGQDAALMGIAFRVQFCDLS